MPRCGPPPKKIGPNKKALASKAPPVTIPAVPPTPPPLPPAPAAQLSGRRSLTASQRDILDEMMGSEVSSDNSSSPETTTPATPQALRRKSPRFPETTTTTTSSAGDVASDDSSLHEPMTTPDMTTGASSSTSRRQNRRKAPAPKKTQTRALKEIAKLQGHTEPVIPKLPFARLIREILMEYSHRNLRITPECLVCLQESAEIFAVQLMEDAYRCTLHRERITLMPKDMKLAVMLRKDSVLM